jgi:hypothetical protein
MMRSWKDLTNPRQTFYSLKFFVSLNSYKEAHPESKLQMTERSYSLNLPFQMTKITLRQKSPFGFPHVLSTGHFVCGGVGGCREPFLQSIFFWEKKKSPFSVCINKMHVPLCVGRGLQ